MRKENDIFSLVKPQVRNSCNQCVCNDCLHWWKGMCPHGGCFDDLRAKARPYNIEHPGKIRNQWSEWDKEGEQEHWCRGGLFYPQLVCEHYIYYRGSEIKECLCAPVQVFQDGTIKCALVEAVGCKECFKRFEKDERLDMEAD